MKKLWILFLLFPLISFAQNETNDMITYDSAIQVTPDGLHFHTYTFRITRPNNADTFSRAAIFFMPGEGENGGTDTNKLVVYGPHYWLKNGWDGSVTLPSGGKRYPILISVISDQTAPYGEDNLQFLNFMLSHYHIRKGAVHVTGLSAGAWAWSSMINYQTSAGAEDGMKNVTSLVCLSGFSTSNLYTGDQTTPYQIGITAYGHWAKKYGGRYFGLQGSTDGVGGIYLPQQNMDDTISGKAYFSYQNNGGGAHCCWNTLYAPTLTHFNSVTTPLGTYNVTNAQPNAQGTYVDGENIFTWELMQGDTAAAGSKLSANAGSDQSLTQPTSSTTLSGSANAPSGGTISTYKWTQVSGASSTITSPTSVSTTITGLSSVGTYAYQFRVTDNLSDTAYDTVQVVVHSNACRTFTWDNTNGNILITNAALSASPNLHGCDTVIIPAKAGGYRTFSMGNIGNANDSEYIFIDAHNAYITPTTSFIGGDTMNNCNWVHVYGLTMNDNLNVFMSSYASTAYSHRIFWDSITLRGMNGFFPSANPTFSSLPNFTGDTTNCFYNWRFHKIYMDSIVGANSGQTALWLGSLTKNQTWIKVRIDSSYFGDYSSASNPSGYIHAQNIYGLEIDHDSLWNLADAVVNPVGHAALIYIQLCQFSIHDNHFGPNNFGDDIRNFGAADIPTMASLFTSWDATYNGRSRVYNNITERKRKYPFMETRTDPTDTASLSPYVRMRTCPETWNITGFRMAMGVGNQYYNSSLVDCYEFDSLFLKNSFIVGPTDTLWTACSSQGCNAIITTPAGAVTKWDTASNKFIQTFTAIGLADSSKYFPTNTGILYNNGITTPSYITTDIYGISRPSVRGSGSGVDIGAVQYTSSLLPPTVNAGNNQTINLPQTSTTLSGTATGNNGATITSTTWIQVSGPNSATITSPNALTTTVTGLILGNYTFQLSATDSNNQAGNSNVTVSVNVGNCNCIPRLKFGKTRFGN